MQGRQRGQGVECVDDRLGEQRRADEADAAMDDAVADRQQAFAAQLLLDPAEQFAEAGIVARFGGKRAVDQRRPVRRLRRQARLVAEVEQPAQHEPRLGGADLVEPELGARRAGIEGKHGVCHQSSGAWRMSPESVQRFRDEDMLKNQGLLHVA